MRRLTVDSQFIKWVAIICFAASSVNLAIVANSALSSELTPQFAKYGSGIFLTLYIGNLIGLFCFSILVIKLNKRFVKALASLLVLQGVITAYMQYTGNWASFGTVSEVWRSDEEVVQFYEILNTCLEITGYTIALSLVALAWRLIFKLRVQNSVPE